VDALRIKLAEKPDFDLGGVRVSPARREVRKGSDRRELEPKVAQVLVALACARSEVVSRDRLMDECWDGRIVGDDALNRCIVALRRLAKEFSPEPFAIETVSRVGYCLIERTSVSRASRGPAKAKIALAALLALFLVSGAVAFGWSRFGRANDTPASIAVLSFRNLSAGDPYFAEGIGEEILGQLSREPQFRVAGRVSSSLFGNDPDVRDVAGRLNVDYVLEGSVRTQGDSVRVNVDLIRARDRMRLWSDSYDGKLDDIFAIQQQIGHAIARALQLKLLRAPTLSGPLVTHGEAYSLYLTARGLIRTRNGRVAATAANLLQDAINIDPRYAPAWASLAEALFLEDAPDKQEQLIAVLPRAQAYARRSLQLAPNLAEGHRILGILLISGSPEALAHLRRAAELDPHSADNMIAFGEALATEGKFDDELAAYRRAGELDPLWFRTIGVQGIALAERGRRTEAESVGRRGFAADINNRHILLGRIAWIDGDYSEAIRQWSPVSRANSPRWSFRARDDVANAMAALGLAKLPAVPDRTGFQGRILIERLRPVGAWLQHNRNEIAADVYSDENQVGAKLMLNAGHANELIKAYDSSVGLLGIHRGQQVRVNQLGQAAIVALALRRAGRSAEADELLHDASVRVQSVYSHNRSVPFSFDAQAAEIWAVQGRTEQALSALERALDRGWIHADATDLPALHDEPTFASLRGQPRFERIKASVAAHLARERAETEMLHT
jgi:TolB-like protein/DNA-binding winged helix-turn-helix (wHTH) protein/tetratricopeptide (TPR) repeat protein